MHPGKSLHVRPQQQQQRASLVTCDLRRAGRSLNLHISSSAYCVTQVNVGKMDSPIEKWNLIIGNLALKQVPSHMKKKDNRKALFGSLNVVLRSSSYC